MFKRFIASLMCASIIICSLPMASNASLFKDYRNMDGRFSEVYSKSTWEKIGPVFWGIVAGVATYITAGTGTVAAAGPFARWIGGLIGSLSGLHGIAAINAGLASIGFGSVASGGLGVLGGVAILNGMGDILLGYVLDTVNSAVMPGNKTHEFLDVIKLKMFYDNVCDQVEDDLDDLKDELGKDVDKINNNKVEYLLNSVEDKLRAHLYFNSKVDSTTAYDYLLLGIINYNNEDFESAKQNFYSSKRFFDAKKSSVADYGLSLIALTEDDQKTAIDYLRHIIRNEPKAIPPYVVLAQIYIDNEDYYTALGTLQSGLEDADDDDYSMNLMMASVHFKMENYYDAIKFYKEALSNISINELEASCKLNIAICYKKLRNYKEALNWLDDAVSEVDDDTHLTAQIKEIYNNS
jgi:tetratricopeptide (TPR) repeat protein